MQKGIGVAMLESSIEGHLKAELKKYGFRCDKGTVPGRAGFPDRWIFRPKWSPGPPMLLELKAPGKAPRKLQVKEGDDLRARGVLVLDYVDTKEKVDKLVTVLVGRACWELSSFDRLGLPQHIKQRLAQYDEIK